MRRVQASRPLLLALVLCLGCQRASSDGPSGGPSGTAEAPACAPLAAAPGAEQAQPLPPLDLTLGVPGEPAPAGEIAFSHKAHAGDCRIPCLACHVYATTSPVAGIPSGRKCMGCHKFVAKEKPGVRILAARVKAEQPLRWRRVFTLPDFIYFSHRAHLRAKAKLECKDCHGDIAAQQVVRQEAPFTMGRCLACHEAKKAPRDCTTCHR